MSTLALRKDSMNRALRSLMQGLGVDILVGIALVLATFVAGWGSWGDVQWSLLTFSIFKSIVQACVSYVMRRFLDHKVPTPLPPGE